MEQSGLETIPPIKFSRAELDTLNDLQELAAVLQTSTSANIHPTASASTGASVTAPSNSRASYHGAGLATNSIFFCFFYSYKIIDLPGGQINQYLWKHYTYYLLFPLATPLAPSWTPEGLFELTWRPSRSLNSPHALLL